MPLPSLVPAPVGVSGNTSEVYQPSAATLLLLAVIFLFGGGGAPDNAYQVPVMAR